MAFATRCPSANQESQEHSTTKHEHHDEDEHRDEDGERTRPTMPLCDAEQKHGCSPANPGYAPDGLPERCAGACPSASRASTAPCARASSSARRPR